MRFIGLIFVIIVIGFMIGFMVLNSQEKVSIDIFGQKVSDISVAMVCFYSFIAGMVFVLIFALADEIALRTNLHRLRKENKNLRKELSALRNLPFEEEK
ncbi:MAG TPA: LapA family protein [candidate division WOR-3 bacterium]|uniref:LapA family protein n=1 Tax=candidate division WOR-3 bacterium TaxID=2052148 RepID=A0A9C9EKA3_UNCW3|nr:LapA family protein [candidate division WOR-3 bacterium]